MNRIYRNILIILFLCVSAILSAKAPKYIFIFIGDGMGAPDVHATNLYKQMTEGKESSLLMTQFPVAGLVTTHCANDIITDSPAAGTALATGVKTNLKYVGIDKNKKPLKSFFQVMKEQGKGISLLTTNAPDDATPASFFASSTSRYKFYQIDTEMAQSNFDFIGGARLRGDSDKNRKTKPVYDIMRENGYTIAEGMESYQQVKNNDKIILLSTNAEEPNAIGLNIDQLPGAMKLSEMTAAALAHLDKRYHKKGFCMMVEGGDIDHTNHVKDLGGTVHEVMGFDEALKVAYAFYRRYPDETLILVTADHETGGLSLGLQSSKYSVDLSPLKYQKISEIRFGKELDRRLSKNGSFSWPQMKKYLEEKLGFWSEYPLSLSEEARLMTAFDNACIKKRGKE